MNLSNISKVLQINTRKQSQTTHSQNKWSFLFEKVLFQNKRSVSAIKGVVNLIAIIGPGINGSVKLIIFTLAKGNTKTCCSTGQIV